MSPYGDEAIKIFLAPRRISSAQHISSAKRISKIQEGFISMNQLFVRQTIDSTVVPLGRESTTVFDILEFI